MSKSVLRKPVVVPTRERLITAAIELFQARGYHGAGVNDVLAAADAPKGSLYHHFPGGKAELAIAAIERVSRDVGQTIVAQTARGVPAADVVLRLGETIGAWMKARGYDCAPLILTLAAAPAPPEVEDAAAAAHRRWRTALAGAAAAEGLKDPAGRAAFALAALEGGVLLARREKDRAPLRAAVKRGAAALSA